MEIQYLKPQTGGRRHVEEGKSIVKVIGGWGGPSSFVSFWSARLQLDGEGGR